MNEELSSREMDARDAEATIKSVERIVFGTFIILGALAVISAAFYSDKGATNLLPWIHSVALGIAFALAGAIVGLLFAVPRRSSIAVATSNGGYDANDNLVKVSDWLTGALTGVALATGKDIVLSAWNLSKEVAPGYPGFVLACIIGGFAAGFLLGYLRLRANLGFIFAYGDRRANDAAALRFAADAKVALNASDLKGRVDMAGTMLKSFGVNEATQTDVVKALRKTFETSLAGDPHKGAFGGAAEVNGYRLGMAKCQVESDGLLAIELEVRCTSASVKPSTVEFHIHPSFPAQRITKPVDEDGVVRLPLKLVETFTVGAVVQPGGIRLELDLNDIAEIPAEYHY